MTVLFAGGGLDSLIAANGNSYEASGTGGFAYSDTQTGTGSSDYSETPEWAAVQEIWAHFRINGTVGTPFQLMNGSTAVFRLSTSGSLGILEYLSGVATWTQVGGTFPRFQTYVYIDLYVKTGASGEVMLFQDGFEVLNETGVDLSYAPDITKARWMDNSRVNGIAIADENTIGWRVVQGLATANGASTDWTGEYTAIDEAVLSDTDYIYSNAANEVETVTATLKTTTVGYYPKAVSVAARGKRGSTGPQNIQLALRSGGTNYFSATKAMGLGYSSVSNVWNTNPDTGLAWTTGQLTGLQPGVKSIT